MTSKPMEKTAPHALAVNPARVKPSAAGVDIVAEDTAVDADPPVALNEQGPGEHGANVAHRPVPDRSEFLSISEESTPGEDGRTASGRNSIRKLIAGLRWRRQTVVEERAQSDGAPAARHHVVHELQPGESTPPPLDSVLFQSFPDGRGDRTVASAQNSRRRRLRAILMAAVAALVLIATAVVAWTLTSGTPDASLTATPLPIAPSPPPSPPTADPQPQPTQTALTPALEEHLPPMPAATVTRPRTAPIELPPAKRASPRPTASSTASPVPPPSPKLDREL